MLGMAQLVPVPSVPENVIVVLRVVEQLASTSTMISGQDKVTGSDSSLIWIVYSTMKVSSSRKPIWAPKQGSLGTTSGKSVGYTATIDSSISSSITYGMFVTVKSKSYLLESPVTSLIL